MPQAFAGAGYDCLRRVLRAFAQAADRNNGAETLLFTEMPADGNWLVAVGQTFRSQVIASVALHRGFHDALQACW